MTSELQILEKKLGRIEAQNRRLMWAIIILLSVGLASAAWGQPSEDVVVKAQKLELRDESGRLRAELAMLNGEPALRFFDSQGIGHSLLSEDQLNFYGKDEDDLTSYAKNGLSVEGKQQKTFITLKIDEKNQTGELRLNDYGSGTYTVVTPKDLARLLKAKGQ